MCVLCVVRFDTQQNHHTHAHKHNHNWRSQITKSSDWDSLQRRNEQKPNIKKMIEVMRDQIKWAAYRRKGSCQPPSHRVCFHVCVWRTCGCVCVKCRWRCDAKYTIVGLFSCWNPAFVSNKTEIVMATNVRRCSTGNRHGHQAMPWMDGRPFARHTQSIQRALINNWTVLLRRGECGRCHHRLSTSTHNEYRMKWLFSAVLSLFRHQIGLSS